MKALFLACLGLLALSACQKMTVHTPEAVQENNAESGGKIDEHGIPERPMDRAVPDQNLSGGGI